MAKNIYLVISPKMMSVSLSEKKIHICTCESGKHKYFADKSCLLLSPDGLIKFKFE